MPTPAVSNIALAGCGEDDRLAGVIIATEDCNAAYGHAQGRAKIGERDVAWAIFIFGEEVGGLPHSAGCTSNINRVAGGVGWINCDFRGRPPVAVPRPSLSMPPGPSGVQLFLASGLVISNVWMRKPTDERSATSSPSPVAETGFCRVSVQLFNEPVRPAGPASFSSVQAPFERLPASVPKASCGLKVPRGLIAPF